MNEYAANWILALPEIYLAASICVVLLVDVFLGARARFVTPTLTLLVLASYVFMSTLEAIRTCVRSCARSRRRNPM